MRLVLGPVTTNRLRDACHVRSDIAAQEYRHVTDALRRRQGQGGMLFVQQVANARFSVAGEKRYPLESGFSDAEPGRFSWPAPGFPSCQRKPPWTSQSHTANACFQARPRTHTGCHVR